MGWLDDIEDRRMERLSNYLSNVENLGSCGLKAAIRLAMKLVDSAAVEILEAELMRRKETG